MAAQDQSVPSPGKRVLLLGATGTIGRATAAALLAHGHHVVCFVRSMPPEDLPNGVIIRCGDVLSATSIKNDGLCGEPFDAIISCMASRTGVAKDAWAIDHDAHIEALKVGNEALISHFILLSAICVQHPLLAFQKAKRAFENKLIASGLTYSIIRPTAFFKSLSGQVDRVKRGKPYLLFGDGALTACKPISNGDLAAYITGCLDDVSRHNKVLPIGGPGPAITPREQGDYLFGLYGQTPRFTHVPAGLLRAISSVLGALTRVIPPLASRAELARIGHYYATQSMLVEENACHERRTPTPNPSPRGGG
ncbi:MAG: NAD(P)H-binding protein, partial [Pseudomonadota bacterium]